MQNKCECNYKDKKNLMEFLRFQKTVLKRYIKFIMKWMKVGNDEYKRAANLVLWLNKYLVLLKAESTFDPIYNMRYVRGQIVYIDFGFRVGNELGGGRYAIVLDCNNYKYEGNITVLPLNSDKEKNNWYSEKYYVKMDKELFDGVSEKADKYIKQLQEKLDMILRKGKLVKLPKKELYDIKRGIDKAKAIKEYLEKVDRKSVANCGQITTVSKMRVVHPIKYDDVLANVVVHADVMERIDKKIKELYFGGLTEK